MLLVEKIKLLLKLKKINLSFFKFRLDQKSHGFIYLNCKFSNV